MAYLIRGGGTVLTGYNLHGEVGRMWLSTYGSVMPTLTLTGELARGLADAVRATLIDTPEITPEKVLALPTEMREAIFFAIVEQLINENNGGQSLIPLTHSDGRAFGYLVPPEAAKKRHERLLSEMSEEARKRHNAPLPADFDINNTFDFEELFSREPQSQADAA